MPWKQNALQKYLSQQYSGGRLKSNKKDFMHFISKKKLCDCRKNITDFNR